MEKLCGGSKAAEDEIEEEDVVTKGRRRKSSARRKYMQSIYVSPDKVSEIKFRIEDQGGKVRVEGSERGLTKLTLEGDDRQIGWAIHQDEGKLGAYKEGDEDILEQYQAQSKGRKKMTKRKSRLTIKNLSGRWFVKSVTKDGEELTGPFDSMDDAVEAKEAMDEVDVAKTFRPEQRTGQWCVIDESNGKIHYTVSSQQEAEAAAREENEREAKRTNKGDPDFVEEMDLGEEGIVEEQAEADPAMTDDPNGTGDPSTMTEGNADEIVDEATEEIIERYSQAPKGMKMGRRGVKKGSRQITRKGQQGRRKSRRTLKQLSGRWFVKQVTKDGEELEGPFDSMDEAVEAKDMMDGEEVKAAPGSLKVGDKVGPNAYNIGEVVRVSSDGSKATVRFSDGHEQEYPSTDLPYNKAPDDDLIETKNGDATDPVFKADEDLPLEEKADGDPRDEEESVMKRLATKWFETTGERLR